MTRVLLVDDEPQLLRALQITLAGTPFEVLTATTGQQALDAVAEKAPDVVVLDLGLPDLDGVEVVRALRTWSQVPILVLSGRLASEAKVAALDAGADDYVTKPFDVEELMARLRAITRRLSGAPQASDATTRIGRWDVDLAARTVTAADGSGEVCHLTPTEWHLLDVLVRNAGSLVGQRRLLQEVWGPAYGTETHYLRQYLKFLRRKLEDDPSRPRHLLTEPGMGYRFVP